MNKQPFLFMTVFILSVFMVQSYTTSDLLNYYSFDNANTTVIQDNRGVNNLTASGTIGNTTFDNGLIGKAINETTGGNVPIYRTNLSQSLHNKSFTINYWYYQYGPTNNQIYISLRNDSGYNGVNSVPDETFIKELSSTISVRNGFGTYLAVTAPSSGTWHMITYIHNDTDKSDTLYIDAVYKNINTTHTFNKTTVAFTIGNFGGSMMDELSIWNKTLSPSDILTLYNNGSGLSFNSTVSPLYTGDVFDVELSTTNALVNPQGIPYVYPSIDGSETIIGTFYITTYNDSTPYYGNDCNYTTTITGQDLFNYDNATLNGWISTGINYYTSTFNALMGRALYLNASGVSTAHKTYTSATRDTEASMIIRLYQTTGVLGNRTPELIVSYQDVLQRDVIPLHLVFQDSSNSSLRKLCISSYNQNTSIETQQFCKPYQMNADDYINLTVYWSSSTKTYSIKADYYSDIDESYRTDSIGQFNPTSTDITNVALNSVNSAYDSMIDSIVIRTIDDGYPTLTLQSTTNTSTAYYFTDTCDYSVIGCYTARFWYRSESIQAYNNYEDFVVCSAVSQSVAEQVSNLDEDSLTGEGLTQGTKYLYVLGTLALTAVFCIVAGYKTQSPRLGMIMAVIFMVIELVFFTVFLWIPVWVLVLMIILAVAGTLLGFVKLQPTGG